MWYILCTRTVHGLLTAYHYHYDVNYYYMSETNTVFVERVFNKEKLFSKKNVRYLLFYTLNKSTLRLVMQVTIHSIYASEHHGVSYETLTHIYGRYGINLSMDIIPTYLTC